MQYLASTYRGPYTFVIFWHKVATELYTTTAATKTVAAAYNETLTGGTAGHLHRLLIGGHFCVRKQGYGIVIARARMDRDVSKA